MSTDEKHIDDIVEKVRKLRAQSMKLTPRIVREIDAHIVNEFFTKGSPGIIHIVSSDDFLYRDHFKQVFDLRLGHTYIYNYPVYPDDPANPLNGKLHNINYGNITSGDITGMFEYPYIHLWKNSNKIGKRLFDNVEELKKDENENYCNKLYQYYEMSKYKDTMKFADRTPLMKKLEGKKMLKCELYIKHPGRNKFFDQLEWLFI
jgi:hypothetical protein